MQAHLQMQNTGKYKRQRDSVFSGTNGLLISRLRFFNTRRETQFLKAYANHTIWPHPNAWRILWCLRSLSVEIRKTKLPFKRSKSNSLPQWQKLNSNWCLFQNQQILRTISYGHDVIHTPDPFPVWGFIMTMVIVISFALERKLHQLTIYLNT